jgi:hypothetical protein
VDPLTLGAAITQIEKSLNSIVDNSRESGDFLIARTAQELLFLLDSFEASTEKVLDKTFNSISEERRQFIGGIQSAIDDLNKGVVTTLDRSERIVDQAYELVKDVTFDTYPTLFRYRGSIVVPDDPSDIRIKVRGANLTYGEPYFKIRDEKYPVTRSTTQDLVITIPRNKLSHDESKIIYDSGKLNISYKSGGFLGFFTDEKSVTYDIEMLILPKKLGSASMQYDALGSEQKEKIYAGEWSHRGGSGCRSFSQSPSAKGRRFDPDRSTITRHSGNSRGEGRGIAIKDTGMTMAICVDRGRFDRDDGFAHYRYKFVEYWTENTNTPMTKDLSAGWRVDSTATIGTNVDKVLFTFTDFTGKSSKHTPSSNPKARYGEVSFDDQGIVLFRPSIPSELTAL